jgi:prolyl 4-hydroxylase
MTSAALRRRRSRDVTLSDNRPHLPTLLAQTGSLGPGMTFLHDDDILVIDGFLTPQDCAYLRDELTISFWEPSLTYQQQPDGVYQNRLLPFRVSESAQQFWFSDGALGALDRIEQRLESIFRLEASYLEEWQATRYARHGKFDYHLDAGYWNDHHAGDRIFTFVLNLDNATKGGGTHFRALDVYVEARAGRLLVWQNLFASGDADHRMIHSSAPLLKGKKTTLITWLRQKRFRLGDSPARRVPHGQAGQAGQESRSHRKRDR